MIGLDTNILVRYLTQDDPAQAEKATREIDQGAASGEVFFITNIVMCELVWVLESGYSLDKTEIVSALDKILRTKEFEFEDKDLLWQCLGEYREGSGDFSDHFIGRLGRKAGCSRTLTFDTKLKKSPLFRVL